MNGFPDVRRWRGGEPGKEEGDAKAQHDGMECPDLMYRIARGL